MNSFHWLRGAPFLFVLLLTSACGGAKATPTSAPATATPPPATAVPANPLILTPLAPPAVSGGPSLGTSGTSSAGIVYTDLQGRFSFVVPVGYQQVANLSIPPNPSNHVNIVTFATPGDSGRFSLSVQDVKPTDRSGAPVTDVPSAQLLELKARATWDAASKLPGFEPLSGQVEATTWAGQPARRFEARIMDSGKTFRVVTTGALYASQYWMMTIGIEDKDYAASIDRVRVVLNSFRFSP